MSPCASCGAELPAGAKFCVECGAPQQQGCASCGAALPPRAKFCMECGTAAGAEAPRAAPAPAGPASPPVAQRRLVSVLFADLVGFTTLSEHRDPEEVRELLSAYFERSRTIIERYGGTVEKFIGDAVMAVWGTPVAREDDAERAVRAALDLTAGVKALGAEVGMPELRVRAGVLTGNAAVDVAAQGEGMVLGDTVNTASRLQSIAAPGTVLVDDVTRRASEAAVAYEPAGVHEVKGREQPVHAFTALRVVAGVGGARRTAGLEAPFVGRDAELAVVVDAAARTRQQRRAEMVLVVGEAGMGKSRLAWEFEKHSDGISEEVRWHRGRCLSYGEGVAYWALAEMVRARAGILEEEDAAGARAKLRAAVQRYVPDERAQRLVEPRLAHLLGLEHRVAPDRADLFSGWRLFFERMAAQDPVVMVFEDLQWADSGLLDFLDYLLDWSAEFPIFVLALSRPEIPRAPTLTLGPLPEEAMRELLGGLVPGLPDELSKRILRRAEGVPLYAVETVRMLLDRGLLAQEGNAYVVTGDVDDLEVPETLHALVAARLDTLDPDERVLLQNASVLGQSFTPAGVAALAGRLAGDVRPVLDRLVAKQVLSFDDDELSAEFGQYGFLQTLLRTIAYGTLSRRDRKAKHLAAARHLQDTFGEQTGEIAEVLAAHFLDAAGADPDAVDAAKIRGWARDTLVEAGRRSVSLALGREAQRAFDQAAALAEDDEARAELLEEAGRAAWLEADADGARERLDAAIRLYEAQGDHGRAARATVVVADVLLESDRLDDALALAQRAVANLPEASKERAAALALVGRMHALAGEHERALEASEAAMVLAEPLHDWNTIASGLVARGTVLSIVRRLEEGRALIAHGLAVALRHDLTEEALRAYNNLAWHEVTSDRLPEGEATIQKALALARSRGDRHWEAVLLSARTDPLTLLGRWDEAEAVAAQAATGIASSGAEVLQPLALIFSARGQLERLDELRKVAAEGRSSVDSQLRDQSTLALATIALARGRAREACDLTLPITGGHPTTRRAGYLIAADATIALDDEGTLSTLVAGVEDHPPGESTPLMRGAAARVAGVLAARRGDREGAEARLTAAAGQFRELRTPFLLAQVLLEQAELVGGENAPALLREARATFAELRAGPWLERTDQALAPTAA